MNGLPPRPYTIEEYTRTVCPECFAERQRRSDEDDAFVDGMLVSHDDRIWMRRFCKAHGESESLYEGDAEIWRARAGWSTPTLQIVPDRADNFAPFPRGYQNGLPASHGQHTCILVLNVTENCNYACPTCYASALSPGAPAPAVPTPSLEECLHTVDTVLARENGKLGVVMLSGGEPTLRRDLEELIERLLERNISRVMINTNGRRILRDDRFAQFLEKHRGRIEIYLQFDGLCGETYKQLRGEDVAEEKIQTLRRLNEAKIFTTLVMTVVQGVNEHEVGAVVKLGLDTPRCAGVAIQPVFGSGRGSGIDPMSRATPTAILRGLSQQTGGLVDWQDFIPLPCSHRDCCDITYLLRTKREGWRSLPKLLGRDELRNWIQYVSNTISFDVASDAVKAMVQSGVLQRVFSEQQKTSALALAADILRMCDCVPGLSDLLVRPAESLESMAERTFRITVKMFMDSHTFHESRIRQCCVHTGTFEDDPRRHSFCWRWLFADAFDVPVRERESTLRMVAT